MLATYVMQIYDSDSCTSKIVRCRFALRHLPALARFGIPR